MNEHKFISLASGTKANNDFGSPTALDMAWSMGRICRWIGAGTHFYSDMLHSFAVADMAPDYLKLHFLIHDGPECIGNDVPSPVKSDATKSAEHKIYSRMLSALGLPELTQLEYALLKQADNRTAAGEAWVVGNAGHRASYPKRDLTAERACRYYLREYPYAETIERSGKGPAEFLRRFHKYYQLRLEYDAYF